MNNRRTNSMMLVCLTVLGLSLYARAQDPPTTQESPAPPSTQAAPVLIKVEDAEAIKASMGKDVILDGVVERASWSGTGKVMQVRFKGADESKVTAVLFEKNKEKFDGAFDSDVAKALTGAHVRITGKLSEFKGSPQVVMGQINQLTIIEKGPAK